MRQPLVILGAGGHGRELLDVVEAINDARPIYRFLGFLDDGAPDVALLARRDATFLGRSSQLSVLDATYVIGVGDPGRRRALDEMASALGRQAATLVHPSATIGADVHIGPGCVLTAGARVTTNVRLGRHVHLNLDSTVSHDCTVGDYVTLSPGARIAGGCTIETEVFLGLSASVLPRRHIGSRTVVGAGAVVVNDLPADVTAVGTPAEALAK